MLSSGFKESEERAVLLPEADAETVRCFDVTSVVKLRCTTRPTPLFTLREGWIT
jgi:hypothetical protein